MKFMLSVIGLLLCVGISNGEEVDDEELCKRIEFRIYTRDNLLEPHVINQTSVEFMKKYIKLPFRILIHGWIDGTIITRTVDLSAMAAKMTQSMLLANEVVVILMDWSSLSFNPLYWVTAGQTPSVGRYLGGMVDRLITLGADPSQIHLIGHSLGAHIAGFAAKAVTKGKLARITGLDPALPGFYNVPQNERLDRTDAHFVDVMHTCSGILGILEPMGHADFYPNGGRNVQPGCFILLLDAGFCSHLRAPNYFMESLDQKHKFQSYSCPEIPVDGIHGCSSSPFQMGYYLNTKARGIFYVETNKKFPFAKNVVS